MLSQLAKDDEYYLLLSAISLLQMICWASSIMGNLKGITVKSF